MAAAPPSSGCFRHDPKSHISHPHLHCSPCYVPTPPPSNPHQPNASAFVTAAQCLHGEPACDEAGCCVEAACTRGGCSVGVRPANPHKEMTPQTHGLDTECTVEGLCGSIWVKALRAEGVKCCEGFKALGTNWIKLNWLNEVLCLSRKEEGWTFNFKASACNNNCSFTMHFIYLKPLSHISCMWACVNGRYSGKSEPPIFHLKTE